MSRPRASARNLAEHLLDAQVAHHLDQLTGPRLEVTVAALVDDVLTAVEGHQIEDLVDRQEVTAVVVRTMATVPSSAAVSGTLELLTELLYEGPPEPYPLGELVDSDRVEALLDGLLALHPALERFMDALADVPLVGTTASRFMGRVAGEVLMANKAVADKVPGLGSLMSFGTSAASRMIGVADKQFDGAIGDTMGRGGAYAVRRLNRIVIETLLDPTTREASLDTWDRLAQHQVVGISQEAMHARISVVRDALHELAITTLGTPRAAHLAEVVVDGFFDRFGGYTPTELLDELDLTREELVADVVRLAPAALGVLRESGDLERLVRRRLEPFYTSPEVTRLLGSSQG